MCRSRRELSNEYLLLVLAKIGVDTAENEPLDVWGKIQFNIHLPPQTSFVLRVCRLASPWYIAFGEKQFCHGVERWIRLLLRPSAAKADARGGPHSPCRLRCRVQRRDIPRELPTSKQTIRVEMVVYVLRCADDKK